MRTTDKLDEKDTRTQGRRQAEAYGVAVCRVLDSHVPLRGGHLWCVSFRKLPQHFPSMPTLSQGCRPVVLSLFPWYYSERPSRHSKKKQNKTKTSIKKERKEISRTGKFLGTMGVCCSHAACVRTFTRGKSQLHTGPSTG